MRIAVLGTGVVGRTIAARLVDVGHAVTMGTRDAAGTMAKAAPDRMGNPPFSIWAADNPSVGLASFAEAAADAELVINATSGDASLAALTEAGAGNLADKVLIDISNPLDHATGFPPSLFVKDTDSLGEQIQAAFPEAKVVKALNTLTARLMVHPEDLAGGDHTIFVCGNDNEAKVTVIELLQSFGHRDIIDLGDITNARGTEMILPLWLRLMIRHETAMFNFKVVR
jgi:predicted dinucleotide-binding enzyme